MSARIERSAGASAPRDGDRLRERVRCALLAIDTPWGGNDGILLLSEAEHRELEALRREKREQSERDLDEAVKQYGLGSKQSARARVKRDGLLARQREESPVIRWVNLDPRLAGVREPTEQPTVEPTPDAAPPTGPVPRYSDAAMDDRILALVHAEPGLNSRQVAERVGCPRGAVYRVKKQGPGYGRTVAQRQSHCPHGHELTPENTLVLPPTERRPWERRDCRTCQILRSRNHRDRKNGRPERHAGFDAATIPLQQSGCCRRGHPWTPENTYLRTNGGRVCQLCAQAKRLANRDAKRLERSPKKSDEKSA